MAIDLAQRNLDEARAHLKEQGWCRVANVLDEAETKDALQRLWNAAETSQRNGDETHLSFLDPNASNVRVFYLMVWDKIFRDLIQHPVAVEMVQSLLGKDYLISNFTANIARPGSKSMGLHSDQALVSPEPWHNITALNVIWCLTDCTFENGATLYIPGSNKWTCRNDIPRNAKQLLKPFEAKAGDILLMSGAVWHTSGANITENQDRALLFGYYTAPYMRQQVNWSRKMPQEMQDGLSEEFQQRLGLGVTANLGEAIMHLKYLDDQFAEEGEVKKAEVSTAELFAQSSHRK